jgi:3alpha(or 20beta)-hydroxysteroid dehydrogenase
MFIWHDVRLNGAWSDAVDKAEQWLGGLDILVNNAGIAGAVAFMELTEEVFLDFMNTNTLGVFLGMKAVVPSMVSAGGGAIVNISSVAGQLGARGALAYTASKFAVTGMTKSAAAELGQYNIRVNSVHPGLVDTPLYRASAAFNQQSIARIPLGRIGRAEELARLIVFLASDESSYCSGAEFTADGARTCQT